MNCLECEEKFTPNTQVSTLMCLDCSIEVNTMVLRGKTRMDGTVQHKKLLKRRQMLLSLKGAVPMYKGANRVNMVCRGCGEKFVTFASFKDRLNYCEYCTKLRNKLPLNSNSLDFGGFKTKQLNK